MGSHTIHRSEVIRRILDSIRRIVRELRLSASAAERSSGLSAAQLFVLHKLGDGKAISVNELAQRTHTHQSSVSVVVQRLVEKRLVRRQRDAGDARRVRLSISAAGLVKLQAAPQAAQDRLIGSLRRMKPRHRDQLAQLLEQFVAGTGETEAIPGLFFEEERRRGTARRGKKKRKVR
jgi:MarR family transcriptional regulator, lower aerobic nicotinate degradation pathway regulator